MDEPIPAPKKERKTEFWYTVIATGVMSVVGVILILSGAFDTDGSPNVGALEAYKTISWTIATTCIGYGSVRTARKFSSDKLLKSEMAAPPAASRR